MAKFFSDRNQNVNVAGIYQSIRSRCTQPKKLDVSVMLDQGDNPQNNNVKIIQWSYRFHRAVGRYPYTSLTQF